MNKEISISFHKRTDRASTQAMYDIPDSSLMSTYMLQDITQRLHERIADRITKDWLKQNKKGVFSKISQKSIANLALAKAAAEIKKEIKS
jgi:hypothetical protein